MPARAGFLAPEETFAIYGAGRAQAPHSLLANGGRRRCDPWPIRSGRSIARPAPSCREKSGRRSHPDEGAERRICGARCTKLNLPFASHSRMSPSFLPKGRRRFQVRHQDGEKKNAATGRWSYALARRSRRGRRLTHRARTHLR